MNTKPWWRSRTLWFNLLMLSVDAASGKLGVHIPPNVAVPILTAGNIGLRLITTQPVSAS